MSISAYPTSSIPSYSRLTTRTNEAKPAIRDTERNDVTTQQPANRSDTSLPSTGLLNTVV